MEATNSDFVPIQSPNSDAEDCCHCGPRRPLVGQALPLLLLEGGWVGPCVPTALSDTMALSVCLSFCLTSAVLVQAGGLAVKVDVSVCVCVCDRGGRHGWSSLR